MKSAIILRMPDCPAEFFKNCIGERERDWLISLQGLTLCNHKISRINVQRNDGMCFSPVHTCMHTYRSSLGQPSYHRENSVQMTLQYFISMVFFVWGVVGGGYLYFFVCAYSSQKSAHFIFYTFLPSFKVTH